MKVYKNYHLLNHNTFGMDVSAEKFVEYETEEELQDIIPSLQGKVLHIGMGSNLLFRGDFHGTILHSAITHCFMTKMSENEVMLRVGGGVCWDDFVAWTVRSGYGGLENLSFIPGEVGASAVQNIGAYGVEAKDVIVEVEAISLEDGHKRCFSNAECEYGYRQSIFKKELKGKFAVTYVTYRLQRKPILKLEYGNIKAAIGEKADVSVFDVRCAIHRSRLAKLPDPRELGNAGSFFMNPIVDKEKFLAIQKDYPQMPFYEVENGVKIPAGWMIEQCGWKGKSLGRAGVYDKQALVLVNLGGATGDEIVALCETICRDVHDRFGIDIHPEVNIV